MSVMNTRTRNCSVAVLLVAALTTLVGCPQSGAPILSVSPGALSFTIGKESSGMTDSFMVINDGGGTLSYSLVEDLPWLTLYSRVGDDFIEVQSGSTTDVDVITVSVNTAGVSPGTLSGEIEVRSNGGNRTIPVALINTTPTLDLDSYVLEFGETMSQQSFTISNAGRDALDWEATIPEDVNWLSLDPEGGSIGKGTEKVSVTVNRDDLAPGEYSADINLSSNAGPATVRVTMVVADAGDDDGGDGDSDDEGDDEPTGALTITPAGVDFGTEETSATLTLANNGTADLRWTLTEDLDWLIASKRGSNLLPGATDTVRLDVLDRGSFDEGTYSGSVLFTYGTSTITINVAMEVPRVELPPELSVSPTTIDFGTTTGEKIVAIWNAGDDTVNWSLDTGEMADWLDVAGASSGAASGSQTDYISLAINRDGLEPGTYSTAFTVTSDAGDLTVSVRMRKPSTPMLAVATGSVDQDTGLPFLPMDIDNTNGTITVSNTGTGTLTWLLQDPQALPEWLALEQVSGTLGEDESSEIGVTGNPTGLAASTYAYDVVFESNGGTVTVEVVLVVPTGPAITVMPQSLVFGADDFSGAFSVANAGDSGTRLEFAIVDNRDWLFFYPETGNSQGVPSGVPLDWQPINVSIDRGALQGVGDVATLTVYAVDSLGNTDENIEPAYVQVAVQAASLTIETPLTHWRVPSLLSWPVILRNIRYRSIFLEPATLEPLYRPTWSVTEQAEPIDLTESNIFLKDGSTLSTNAIILLDYSASMWTSANLFYDSSPDDAAFVAYRDDRGLAPDAVVDDPLQALYEYYAGNVIRSLPDHYRVAVLEFHDRQRPVGRSPNLVFLFTKDKAEQLAQLRSINVNNHGASEVLVEMENSASLLYKADSPFIPSSMDLDPLDGVAENQMGAFYYPYDGAEVKALFMFTDGRITTPPGKINDTILTLQSSRTRLFAIGWGDKVNHEPLARIASATGGHYYPTRKREAQLSSCDLATICGTPSPEACGADECGKSIAQDMDAQLLFRYVSLKEEPSVTVRVASSFDDPNDDDNLCGLEDQGQITGDFVETVNVDEFVGDTALGQIGLRTEGIDADGNCEIVLICTHVPRNISEYQFNLTAPHAFTISRVPTVEGGLVENWPEVSAEAGYNFRIQSPDGQPLRYGDAGAMLRLNFTSVPGPFTLSLDIDNSLYEDNEWPIEDRYFIWPNAIDVNYYERYAPALPTPFITLVRPVHEQIAMTFDMGTAEQDIEMLLENIGGTYPYGSTNYVYLTWEIDNLPSFLSVPDNALSYGKLTEGVGVRETLRLEADRDADVGRNSGTIWLVFSYFDGGSRNELLANVSVWIDILAPEMDVSDIPGDWPNGADPSKVLDFGDSLDVQSFDLSNSGQSVLSWKINRPANWPDWLEWDSVDGELPYSDNTELLSLRLDRVAADEGPFSFSVDLVGRDNDGGLVDVAVAPGDPAVTAIVPVEVTGTILPPQLGVSRNSVNLGDTDSSMSVEVRNLGNRVLYWSVDTDVAGWPDWLTVQPAGGLVPYGADPASLTINVDRASAPATFNYSFDVIARDGSIDGDLLTPQTITVSGTN